MRAGRAPRLYEQEVAQPLRTVVQDHADACFLDTDGVTRDAGRMMQIMDSWHPKRTDGQAGIRRNTAFDPTLSVVVRSGTRIYYAAPDKGGGQPDLLFTIVPRDGS
ncbi:MAG: hypothetical protein PVSMB7_29530 [Chloroflexota bacterium]